MRAKVGDVFLVPVSPDQRVYGQVLDRTGPQFLVVVFRSAVGPIAEVLSSGIELAGIVFDAKFRNGDWPIVTNMAPVPVTAPWFVLGHEALDNLRLVNFDSSVTRVASPTEDRAHHHRNISYPMALQMAAEAVFGSRPWRSELDCYRELAVELS